MRAVRGAARISAGYAGDLPLPVRNSCGLQAPVEPAGTRRHTHATLALEAGVHPRIVQERLGHATVSITLDTYSHVDLDLQAAAAARVAALLTAADPDEPRLPGIL